jgi:hypothetical protein
MITERHHKQAMIEAFIDRMPMEDLQYLLQHLINNDKLYVFSLTHKEFDSPFSAAINGDVIQLTME